MTAPAVDPAGVSELDAVIELMNAKVAGAEFNGIKAFEHEPRRIRAVLLAARQQLAEMRGVLEGYRDFRAGKPTRPLSELDTMANAALAPTSQPSRGTFQCPICGVDTQHRHNAGEIGHWLRAQAGRFGLDAVTCMEASRERRCTLCKEDHCPSCHGSGKSKDRTQLCPDCAQPSRGKCETCGGDGRVRLEIDGGTELRTCPKCCGTGYADCAQPERHGADDIIAELQSILNFERWSTPSPGERRTIERVIAALGEKPIPLGTITDAVVYKMCHYLRDKDCAKCPAAIATPYGDGEPGCYGIAFETVQMARCFLYEAAQLPSPPLGAS